MVHQISQCLAAPAADVLGQDLGFGLGDEAAPDPREGDAFGTLVRLVRDNERLLAELAEVRSRSTRAWHYLAEPGCNAALAIAQLDRLRQRRSSLLAQLRANRIEARGLLGGRTPADFAIEMN